MKNAAKPKILIIDDNSENITVLTETLLPFYTVYSAKSGSKGFELALQNKPDLILLDILMPEMDGYDTCKKIRENELIKTVPIIFLTAKTSQEDIIKGLDTGAVDYITKPFNRAELQARVSTHIELNIARQLLKNQNELLEARVQERTAELLNKNDELTQSYENLKKMQKKLIDLEKQTVLVSSIAGMTHDISNPVGSCLVASSHLESLIQRFTALVTDNQLKRSDLDQFMEELVETSDILNSNIQKASDLIRTCKTISIDHASGKKKVFNLKDYMHDILVSLKPKLKYSTHKIEISCEERIFIDSFPGAFYQIFSNLIINSLIHGFEDVDNGEINIEFLTEGKTLKLIYRDNGKGLSEDIYKEVFMPYYTTKADSGGSGLGMHIINQIITEKLSGEIALKSAPGNGFKIEVKLPDMVCID